MLFGRCRPHRTTPFVAALALSGICILSQDGRAAEDEAQTANDPREKIQLSQSDRETVRAEMRALLRSLGLILQGLVGNDLTMIERAARRSGLEAALKPETANALPAEYVQLDKRLHQRFDQVADTAKTGKNQDLLKRVAALSGYCVTCHDTYRFENMR